MLNLAQAVRQLKNERAQAQKTLVKLETVLRTLGSLGVSHGGHGRPRVQGQKRTMSAAARKRIAAAQRARWAKWRAARRNKGKGSRSRSGKD